MFYLALLSVSFLYLFNLGLNDVWIPNEAFYADSARNMLESGDLITPVYNGELRLNKPPMTYWITLLGFLIFGLNEFGLRVFQALSGIGTGILTYLIGKRLIGERAGVLSFIILTLSFQFIANSRYTSPEAPFTFFITLTLYLWFKGYSEKRNIFILLSFIASSLAVLTKGPAGFVLPALVVFTYLLITDRREILKLKYYAGTLLVLLLSGWWFLYQYVVNRETFLEVFLKENIKRIYALQRDPFYYYLLDINVSFLPYSFLIFLALGWVIHRRRKELLFPAVWLLSILTLFSLVKMKIPVYIMPAFPAMALLTSAFLLSPDWKVLKYSALSLLGFLLLVVTAFGGKFLGIETNIILVIIILVAFSILFLKRWFNLLPAVGGAGLLLSISLTILPEIERYRPYELIGGIIKENRGEARVYEIGYFHHNLPFYSGGVVIRNKKLTQVQKPAVVLLRGKAECETLWKGKLYTGSESRFFVFLQDIKTGRRFDDFTLCIFR